MSKIAKVIDEGQVRTTCIVGVDAHKNTNAVTIIRSDGQRKSVVCPADAKATFATILRFAGSIKLLVYEAGPTGFTLAWACQENAIPVLVVAPSRVPRPVTAGAKTDKLDSKKLAEYAAQGMLTSIAIPTREEYALRKTERMRQAMGYCIRKQKQEVKSFLLENGIPEPAGLQYWSKASVEALKVMTLSPLLRVLLDNLLYMLESYQSQQKHLASLLAQEMKAAGKHQIVECLTSIPGVGETIAHAFTAEIFRPERFTSAEQIAAYIGLAPVTIQSGHTKNVSRTKPTGQQYLRSVLVEGAWLWKTKDPRAQALYSRILSRTGLAQKAIVAVARKFLLVLWRISVEQRPYWVSTADGVPAAR